MSGSEIIEGYYEYNMDSFEFENGRVLEDVKVQYSVIGAPKFDDEGNPTNIIIYCHRFSGDYSSIDDMFNLTKKGEPFDKNEYCFISITSLGFPNSCSPSSTGLKHKFPQYTIRDRVNFKRQFLKEKFGIDKVYGIVGRGLGGYEIYTWACEFPDEMDFIIIASSSYKTNGYRYVVSKAVDSIIESSDDFYQDIYTESLSRIMVSIYKIIYSNYFSKRIFQDMSNDEIDVLMDDFVDEGLFTDIYDFKFRNDSILEYDVESKLKNIKAKTLIISPTDDLYYTPEFDAIPLEELIDDCRLILYNSKIDMAGFEDYSFLSKDIGLFLDELKK